MYITTSTFHIGAQNFLDSFDNVVGVDGEKIFALAMQTLYGIRKSRAGYTFDPTVFD
jgi:restriction endonuclease Mrr